jgi:7,8-dihydropterin-6-yl-methyl-4-(beta-D-ribofuranosyl)aminobenzene 5'-phosphate synthase
MKVFLPTSLEGDFEKQVEASGGRVCIKSNCKRIAKDIYISGEMGFQIREQALVIDTKKGLVIITGCGHPGIDRMVAMIKENFQKEVFLVMGGFHTLEANLEEADRIIERFQQMDVKKVAPSHCTGKLTMKMFKDAYQTNFIENGTGKIIEI